ncbi:hypothetical protein BDP27DRAFT_1364859 [Rhodocollybia butyracea]|uniref:Uncharacterized protein n=1 Tax=Rhodocollybia butyracea TaxID=206335 RepID=A0A9P5U6A0_9AGAR|nr:hypothetical protein BDP27DRAFT_1364859 [Rhodocollybia butyracea]
MTYGVLIAYFPTFWKPKRQELARVCMIDYDTQLVGYEVKPRWSGITAGALATATTTFSEAQAHVLSPVSSFTPKPNPFYIQKNHFCFLSLSATNLDSPETLA